MNERPRARAALLLAAFLALGAAALHGESEVGWYVIRPGDTLEGLATRFLGDPRNWAELHRLNPRILDPHWIYPGRRVRVPVARPSVEPNAQVTVVANRVEALPTPVDWVPAGAGDLLVERDGLRTFEDSSARLLFDDGTTAVVSPDSLVFIRRQTPATAPAPRKEIEIELGQAEFEARRGELPAPEIEVVVGGARATTRIGADGELRSRHRREGDDARVMLYRGAGEVRADAGTVQLAAGTGTTVRPGAAPTAPERLLAAPELLSPRDRAELPVDSRRVELKWSPVEGADGYLVEVCADARCGAILERSDRLAETTYRLRSGYRRPLYWRVTAIASSGLDGFPSSPRQLRPALLISIQ